MIAVVVMLRSKENNSHAPYDNDIISYGEKRDHTIITGQCLASTGWQNFSNVILYGNEAFIIDLCSYDLHLFFPSTTEQGIPVSCYFYRCCYIVLLVISCQLRSSQIVLYLYQKVCMFIRFFRCTHCFHKKWFEASRKK